MNNPTMMTSKLPEGWTWYTHQAGKHDWFTGSWTVAIYRKGPKWWPFLRLVARGYGWTETEAHNHCIDRLSDEQLAVVRAAQ